MFVVPFGIIFLGYWSLANPQDDTTTDDSSALTSSAQLGSDEGSKRGWNALSGGWGKRDLNWNQLNGMWGKRDWNDLSGMWGKRSWRQLPWRKTSGFVNHSSSLTKDWNNQDPDNRRWRNPNGSWRKKTWDIFNGVWANKLSSYHADLKRSWNDCEDPEGTRLREVTKEIGKVTESKERKR